MTGLTGSDAETDVAVEPLEAAPRSVADVAADEVGEATVADQPTVVLLDQPTVVLDMSLPQRRVLRDQATRAPEPATAHIGAASPHSLWVVIRLRVWPLGNARNEAIRLFAARP
jgi:hypothetical protein